MNNSLLCIDNLNVSYNNEHILHNINIKVEKGEILGIVGESGSGKSTLLKSIEGFLGKDGRITSGMIKFNDTNLLKLSKEDMREIRGKSLSMIFQNPESYLCPIRTIEKQFIETVRCHEKACISDIRKRVSEIFSQIGLKDTERIMKSYPFELSGGMNQRVAIALAIIENPKLILADEPTSALDVTTQAQVMKTLVKLNKLFDTAIVMITHNIKVVSYMADNIAVMYKGNVVEYGSKEGILNNPKHPYTKFLISSTPNIKSRRIFEIPETADFSEEKYRGCPFAAQCCRKIAKCICEKPDVIRKYNREVACHLYFEEEKEEAI